MLTLTPTALKRNILESNRTLDKMNELGGRTRSSTPRGQTRTIKDGQSVPKPLRVPNTPDPPQHLQSDPTRHQAPNARGAQTRADKEHTRTMTNCTGKAWTGSRRPGWSPDRAGPDRIGAQR